MNVLAYRIGASHDSMSRNLSWMFVHTTQKKRKCANPNHIYDRKTHTQKFENRKATTKTGNVEKCISSAKRFFFFVENCTKATFNQTLLLRAVFYCISTTIKLFYLFYQGRKKLYATSPFELGPVTLKQHAIIHNGCRLTSMCSFFIANRKMAIIKT